MKNACYDKQHYLWKHNIFWMIGLINNNIIIKRLVALTTTQKW